MNHRIATYARRWSERQGEGGIREKYEPVIRAVRGEAPSISRCMTLQAPTLGRRVHALSGAEISAMLFALYHPALIDIQEQRGLPLDTAANPIGAYRTLGPTEPQNQTGTIFIAEDLGDVSKHPMFLAEIPDPVSGSVRRTWSALPLTGDLLLILRSNVDDIYAVNWTIKNNAEAFTHQLARDRSSVSPASEAKARLRHELEARSYASVGIRTIRVTSASFDRALTRNLGMLHTFACRKIGVSPRVRDKVVDALRCVVGTKTAPLAIFPALEKECGISAATCRDVLFEAIWHRDVPVDLFTPVQVDKPLRRKEVDELEVYSGYFSPKGTD